MCLRILASIFLFVLFAWTPGADGQRSGRSASFSPAWNDNSLIAAQRAGGEPHRSGDVKIEFYGHDAFKITSPGGLTVLADPWRNDPTGAYPKWFLNEFPAIPVDIVLSTHAHFDHDAVERPRGLIILERLIGEFKLGDVQINGLADKHVCDSTHTETCPPNNPIQFDNAIQIIETGGLRIAVWGDNRAMPDPFLDDFLKDVDVLILPVETVLTPAQVEAIVRKYDPKAVIPAHYYVHGLTTSTSGLESPERWVNEQQKLYHADVRRLDRADLTLNPAELKGAHHRVYYFGDHFEDK
jgi:L-ascorbate metabolism protein UlaG (beta-lactamase superfamily)